jgi:hypothetical protein
MDIFSRTRSPEDQFAAVIQACERLHRKLIPLTAENLNAEFPDLTVPQCRKLLESDRLTQALAARGIDFVPVDALTAHQVHALAIYADTSIPMTHRERLRNARVTQAKWDGWMRNPRFMARLEELAEERLAGSNPNAVLKLLEAVDKGERWAIEMSLEMTGRHRRNQDGQDPSALFAALFQVLDEAGVPQETMQKIGQRFRELANPGSAPARVAATILAPTGQQAASITSLEE